jgi:hypothetical protein
MFPVSTDWVFDKSTSPKVGTKIRRPPVVAQSVGLLCGLRAREFEFCLMVTFPFCFCLCAFYCIGSTHSGCPCGGNNLYT